MEMLSEIYSDINVARWAGQEAEESKEEQHPQNHAFWCCGADETPATVDMPLLLLACILLARNLWGLLDGHTTTVDYFALLHCLLHLMHKCLMHATTRSCLHHDGRLQTANTSRWVVTRTMGLMSI